MPAEWAEHKATWLTWPHDEAHWLGLFDKIPAIWARMVKELEMGEEVHILIHDDRTKTVADKAMDSLGVNGERVHVHSVPNNFAWMRDHGPTFLINKNNSKQCLLDWNYNAWGNKWAFDLDDQIPKHISKITQIDRIKVPMVLEGGSIDVNGEGCLLTTKACLLHPNRNPDFDQHKIEDMLCTYLGVEKILWLEEGIIGDDTDGHVDDITRFVSTNTILSMVEHNKTDENYQALQHNLKLLKQMTDTQNKHFEIIELPMPKSPVVHDGQRLPASYANFYMGNHVILLPIYNDPHDQIAVDTLEKLFPDRTIAAIPANDLIWGLGAFHCVTQQQPLSAE